MCKKINGICTGIIIGTLLLFMLSIVVRFITFEIKEKFNITSGVVKLVWQDNLKALELEENPTVNAASTEKVNWQKVYPLDTDSDTDAVPMSEKIKNVKKKIISMENNIEMFTKDLLMGRVNFIVYANRMEKLIGWNIQNFSEYNSLLFMEDGYLTGIVEKRDVTEALNSINDFNLYLKENNIPLAYIQSPFKISKFEDTDLSGIIDFSNQNADKFLKGLSDLGIPSLDLRDTIKKEGFPHHELFYRTDHHWRVETGLWATGVVAEYLNNGFDFDIDTGLYKKENYNFEVYPDWFLGSQGKKVTLAKTTADDFTVVSPKFKTDINYKILSQGFDKTGDFKIMMDTSLLEEKDLYYNNTYKVYSDGVDFLETENKAVENDKSILILSDSFADVVKPFISLGVKKTYSIDLRYFKGSLKGFIEDKKPDMVLIMYNPSVIPKTIEYKEHNDLFDFN